MSENINVTEGLEVDKEEETAVTPEDETDSVVE